ncbi:hypothetical protein COU53_01145 [Candidatus Pacearchaeota archaeon CG10_big_fil_rev_8_21_14_0_10_30_48]|nr:MAG: hypothetical protein COU53_01145 [Candidatus Pacearchaeota archaeon CG10_big_fil_rev_8_21_14_0_10_30_48]
MENLIYVFFGIIILFFILLGIKQFMSKKFKERFCVICASISLTWFILLTLFYLNIFDNILILAVLIGSSISGVYYLVESKVSEKIKIFRLPFILTLIFIGYILIEGIEGVLSVIILLAILWISFLIIYNYSSSNNSLVKKLIECCKKW